MAPRALLQALIGRSVAAGLRTPCRARAPFRISRHREKRRTSPPNTGGPLPGADARGATAIEAGVPSPVSRTLTGRNLKGKKCGSIATTAGWCSARTIGLTFGRTFSSGIESPLPKPIPSPLALSSTAASGSGAMTAAKSISINPQKCSNTNRSFLTLSLPIRYFEIFRAGGRASIPKRCLWVAYPCGFCKGAAFKLESRN